MSYSRNPKNLSPFLLPCLLAAACAGKSPPVDAGPPAWPAAPDPSIARLVDAASGDGLLAMAMIHPQAWRDLGRQLAPFPPFQELLRDAPWLASEDLWSALRAILSPGDRPTETARPAPAGWDRSRPLAVAWVDDSPDGLIARFNATLFDQASSRLHVRLVVPATDAATLAKALRDVLASLPGEAGPAGQYVLRGETEARLGVGVFPGGDFVRLEVFYFTDDDPPAKVRQAILLRELAAARTPSRAAKAELAEDPIGKLMATGRGVALRIRTLALARWLHGEVPRKIAGALFAVDGQYRTQIKIVGSAEWLLGTVILLAANPEIAESAVALDFAHGMEAVSLSRLTVAGQERMAAVFPRDVRPPATVPTALLSLAVAVPGPGAAPADLPYRSLLAARSLEEMLRSVQEGGTAAWLALGTQPLALWQTFRQDPDLARALRLPARWPSEVAFELLDLSLRDVSFQVRGRLPAGDASIPHWITTLEHQARGMGEPEPQVRVDAGTDAAWITWRKNVTQSLAIDGAAALAREPAGTLAVLRADIAAIVDRLELGGSRHRRDREYAQLLRLLGRVESRVRWRDGWVIGDWRVGAPAGAAPLPPREVAWPSSAPLAPPRMGAGEQGLLHAVAGAQRMLNALGNVDASMRPTVLARGRSAFAADLADARRDQATMFEAMALDRLLLTLTKDLEIQGIKDAMERACPQGSAVDGATEAPAGEAIDGDTPPVVIEPIRPAPRHPRKRPSPRPSPNGRGGRR